MRANRREVAAGMGVTAVLLWMAAVVVDAGLVAVVVPILMLMGSGLLLATAEPGE